jgi:hypothetical protein
MFANGVIAEGFAPLLYSLGLVICGVLLFIFDKSPEKFNFRAALMQGAHGKALAFFLLNILMLILLFLFGPLIAMFAFSISACLVLKRLTPRIMLLFSAVFVIVIYFIFVILVKLPFGEGIIFEMLRYS